MQSQSQRTKVNRTKKGPQKKWSEEDTLKVLNYLIETIQNNGQIEKPTAKIYYEKLLSKQKIEDVTADILKHKVRNLKTSYLKAVEWLNQTGQGLLEDNDEKTVKGK